MTRDMRPKAILNAENSKSTDCYVSSVNMAEKGACEGNSRDARCAMCRKRKNAMGIPLD